MNCRNFALEEKREKMRKVIEQPLKKIEPIRQIQSKVAIDIEQDPEQNIPNFAKID